MKHGLIKVAAAIPAVKVADTKFNLIETEKQIAIAEGQGVEIIVFPELSITGYTCQDLFQQQLLLDDTEQAVIELLEFTRQLDITVIVGAPVAVGALLLNCALVIQQGKLLGIVAKTFLPNYSEFYEKRWFASSQDLRPQHILFAGNNIRVTPELQIFRTSEGATFAIEICEEQSSCLGRCRDYLQPFYQRRTHRKAHLLEVTACPAKRTHYQRIRL